MDIATAKTLVSALTVLAVVGFSLISFQMAFENVARDLRAAWAGRSAGTRDEAARVRSSAAI